MGQEDDVQLDDETQSGEGERTLAFRDTVERDAPKAEVWEVISDPEELAACVPGAESIERVSEREYTVEITRGISRFTVSLSGEAEFVEMNPPDYIVTTGSAYDTKTGSDFEVLAAMEMDDDGAGTVLTYKAEVTLSGGITSLNTRMIKPIVARDVNSYFENVKDRIEVAED